MTQRGNSNIMFGNNQRAGDAAIPDGLLQSARSSGAVGQAAMPCYCHPHTVYVFFFSVFSLHTFILLTQLDISRRELTTIPSSVWNINLDAGKGKDIDISAGGGAGSWWDQQELTKLVRVPCTVHRPLRCIHGPLPQKEARRAPCRVDRRCARPHMRSQKRGCLELSPPFQPSPFPLTSIPFPLADAQYHRDASANMICTST